MKVLLCMALVFVGWACATGPAIAQDLVIYPKQGQSQEQMEKDKFDCHSWAKAQSGFVPWKLPP